jgi:fumarylpyruvate hydrolase
MNFVFNPDAPATVPVAGSDAVFPVRRIYCVGRNYAAHAREMGADERDPPFFFCKPADAIVVCPPGRTVELPYPGLTADYQHEIDWSTSGVMRSGWT